MGGGGLTCPSNPEIASVLPPALLVLLFSSTRWPKRTLLQQCRQKWYPELKSLDAGATEDSQLMAASLSNEILNKGCHQEKVPIQKNN